MRNRGLQSHPGVVAFVSLLLLGFFVGSTAQATTRFREFSLPRVGSAPLGTPRDPTGTSGSPSTPATGSAGSPRTVASPASSLSPPQTVIRGGSRWGLTGTSGSPSTRATGSEGSAPREPLLSSP